MKFSTDREAVDLVNASPFGLGGSVFSQNTYRAEIMGRLIKTGMCNINDFAVNYLCQSLPFGGVKRSGFGRFAGVEGLRGECVVKCVTVDRLPFVKTTIPPLLDYPLNRERSTAFCQELARTVYGQTWGAKVAAVINLVKVSVFGSAPKQ